MEEKFCYFCHKNIPALEYDAHCKTHIRPRADGQQSEYATLPESQRATGDLTGVPKVYVHKKCGVATGMPESIIRTYLQNPFFYGADATFCHGCKTHVPHNECYWRETGENLQTYFDNLRVPTAPEKRNIVAFVKWTIIGMVIINWIYIFSRH